MCDAAYLCQTEQLERSALAQVALLPHLEENDRKQVPSPDEVRREFDEWLRTEPVETVMTPADAEAAALYRLLGVGNKKG